MKITDTLGRVLSRMKKQEVPNISVMEIMWTTDFGIPKNNAESKFQHWKINAGNLF